MNSTKNRTYYGKRLLSQAISDPEVNALDREQVNEYVREEASRLCLDAEAVTASAMTCYENVTTTDFKEATEHGSYQGVVW